MIRVCDAMHTTLTVPAEKRERHSSLDGLRDCAAGQEAGRAKTF